MIQAQTWPGGSGGKARCFAKLAATWASMTKSRSVLRLADPLIASESQQPSAGHRVGRAPRRPTATRVNSVWHSWRGPDRRLLRTGQTVVGSQGPNKLSPRPREYLIATSQINDRAHSAHVHPSGGNTNGHDPGGRHTPGRDPDGFAAAADLAGA